MSLLNQHFNPTDARARASVGINYLEIKEVDVVATTSTSKSEYYDLKKINVAAASLIFLDNDLNIKVSNAGAPALLTKSISNNFRRQS